MVAGDDARDGRPASSGPAGSFEGEHPAPDALSPEEQGVLAAFERLRPEGSLRFAFDAAMLQLDRPEHTASTRLPWAGLPGDLWERGRAARISRRFVGDVTAALAEVMAADARAAADAAVSAGHEDRFRAAYDALRFLAARVETLEDRSDPSKLVPADLDLPVPDCSEWTDSLTAWLGRDTSAAGPVVVGEARDPRLLSAAAATGRPVFGIEPRGAVVWESLAARPQATLVMAELSDFVAMLPDDSVAGLALAGCVDRIDLVAQCALARHALRAVAPSGCVVLFVTDQTRWDEALDPPCRDLLPGRPLHPETWSLLLRRSGADSVVWHRPSSEGAVHAVVADIGR